MSQPAFEADAQDARKHQTKKSRATRKSVIDATIACFIELGYHRTTTTEIAKRAQVTRGAVQYYFPTTADVLTASIERLLEEWMATYAEELRKLPPSENKFDHGIDTYWKFIRHPLFVAWQELVAASRTDPELAKIIKSAAETYDRKRQEAGREIYPDHQQSAGENFDLGRDFARVVLEGLSLTQLTYDREDREKSIIDLLKKTVAELWRLE